MPSIDLSVYRIDDDRVPLDELLDDDQVLTFVRPGNMGADAEGLFAYVLSDESEPRWVSYLRPAFEDLGKLATKYLRAVYLIRYRRESTFAITFGTAAHHLVSQSSIRRNWGRKIALNLLYDASGDLVDSGRRVRKSRASRVGGGISSEVQTALDAAIDDMGVDRYGDMLRAITVHVDKKGWGKYVCGADSLRMQWAGAVSGLAALCGELGELSERDNYKRDFSFVDHFTQVRDASVVSAVWNAVAAEVRGEAMHGLGLTSSDSVDLASVRLSIMGIRDNIARGGHDLESLEVAAYGAVLGSLGALRSFDSEDLGRHRVRVTDSDGGVISERPVKFWVEGSLKVGGVYYAINDGVVYEIDEDYLLTLEKFIDGIDADAALQYALPSFCAAPARQSGGNLVRDGAS